MDREKSTQILLLHSNTVYYFIFPSLYTLASNAHTSRGRQDFRRYCLLGLCRRFDSHDFLGFRCQIGGRQSEILNSIDQKKNLLDEYRGVFCFGHEHWDMWAQSPNRIVFPFVCCGLSFCMFIKPNLALLWLCV